MVARVGDDWAEVIKISPDNKTITYRPLTSSVTREQAIPPDPYYLSLPSVAALWLARRSLSIDGDEELMLEIEIHLGLCDPVGKEKKFEIEPGLLEALATVGPEKGDKALVPVGNGFIILPKKFMEGWTGELPVHSVYATSDFVAAGIRIGEHPATTDGSNLPKRLQQIADALRLFLVAS